MGRVSGEPGLAEVIMQQRELLSRMRSAVEAKDAENAALRAELEASREQERRLELRLAELERRLRMDSTDSGMPSSKERIGAKEARRARRQESERDRRKDRKRGGQPGHRGKGPRRDQHPDEKKTAIPPGECRRCGVGLDSAEAVRPRWAQVINVEMIRKATQWLLPGPGVPVLRDRHVRGGAPRRACGLGVLRPGAERYWHTLATLARWCRIRSYLDSAAAHGFSALDAIRGALARKPGLPPLPHAGLTPIHHTP